MAHLHAGKNATHRAHAGAAVLARNAPLTSDGVLSS